MSRSQLWVLENHGPMRFLKCGYLSIMLKRLFAALRGTSADSAPERSHVTLGIVQMNNDQYGLAEATLRAGMAKAGETAILLTNLAKVFGERGDKRSMPAR